MIGWNDLRTSQKGVHFSCVWEADVLVAYADGWKDKARTIPSYSIAFGSQYPEVRPGDTISLEDSWLRVKADYATNESYLEKMLTVEEIAQHQWDALMSLLHNWGPGNLRRSTLIQKINAGEMAAAGDLFPSTKFGSSGLLARRLAEKKLWHTGDYGELGPIKLYRGDPRLKPWQAGYIPVEPIKFPYE